MRERKGVLGLQKPNRNMGFFLGHFTTSTALEKQQTWGKIQSDVTRESIILQHIFFCYGC
jgi:hypothetical protein